MIDAFTRICRLFNRWRSHRNGLRCVHVLIIVEELEAKFTIWWHNWWVLGLQGLRDRVVMVVTGLDARDDWLLFGYAGLLLLHALGLLNHGLWLLGLEHFFQIWWGGFYSLVRCFQSLRVVIDCVLHQTWVLGTSFGGLTFVLSGIGGGLLIDWFLRCVALV